MTAKTIAATLAQRAMAEKTATKRNRDSCDSFNSVWTLNSLAVACNCSKELATTSPIRSRSSSSFLILSSDAPLFGWACRSPSVATIPLAAAMRGVIALMIGMIWMAIFLFLHNVKEHATLSAGAHVDHGVDVGITENHVNRAADRGCCVSS